MPDGFLASRELAGLFAPRTAAENYVSVDSATEFRVMGDRGHEHGVFVDDSDVFHVADWFPDREPAVAWSTNSEHAVQVQIALWSPLTSPWRGRVTWRNPLAPGELSDGFSVERERAVWRVSWDAGAQWASEVRAEFAGSRLAGLAIWFPFTPEQILQSFAHPPGIVGLVPYRRFERISVEEALRES